MQLTLFTDYSIRVLMYLGTHHDRLCTTKEISERYGISKNHVVKVVHRLAQLGYIRSVKGKGGGLSLLKDASDINLRDLISALEPNLNLVECFSDTHSICRIGSICKLKGILEKALKAFLDTLGDYTLADMLMKPKVFQSVMKTED
jgi:Rrf2 family nitric oxide-sensitive transcriptional repressor